MASTSEAAGKVVDMKLKFLPDDDNADPAELAKTRIQNASQEKIRAAHENNRLENNPIKSAKEFMANVMYSVPLSKLYQVVASCQYNEGADFCPVLVKIKDEFI